MRLSLVAAVCRGRVSGPHEQAALRGLLTGDAGANRIEGGAGNDRLTGVAGADSLLGGAGDDRFVISAFGDLTDREVIAGEAGIDELRHAGTTAGTLDLGAGVNVERVVIGTGTAAAAVLTGTAPINVDASALLQGVSMLGNAGTNRLIGSGFADMLNGGAGLDTLYGAFGNDRLVGGQGADQFLFGSTGAGADTSVDFNRLDGGMNEFDVLRFENLEVGTFAYLGGGQFTGGYDNSEARVDGNQVLVDTDRSGVADMTITIMGLTFANDLDETGLLFV